jgi:hypothetical protein
MGDRKRIGSLFCFLTNHVRNRMAIRTQIRTRVDSPLTSQADSSNDLRNDFLLRNLDLSNTMFLRKFAFTNRFLTSATKRCLAEKLLDTRLFDTYVETLLNILLEFGEFSHTRFNKIKLATNRKSLMSLFHLDGFCFIIPGQ